MSQPIPETPINNDEFARIFEQYRIRIEEITQQTETGLENLRSLPLESAGEAETVKSDEIKTSPDMPPAGMPSEKIEPVTIKESEKIIKEARRQAKTILREAEEQVKKEAKKKTRAEVDKLLAEARCEADKFVTETRCVVEQEKEAAIKAAKTQMESILADITENARREATQKSQQIINYIIL